MGVETGKNFQGRHETPIPFLTRVSSPKITIYHLEKEQTVETFIDTPVV